MTVSINVNQCDWKLFAWLSMAGSIVVIITTVKLEI